MGRMKAQNLDLADMAQATVKGRAVGAGTGTPVDLSAAQVATIINVTGLPTYNLIVPATGTALVKTGVMTTGYIPFGVAGSLVGEDAGLFWDNTNKQIIIGGSGLFGSTRKLLFQGDYAGSGELPAGGFYTTSGENSTIIYPSYDSATSGLKVMIGYWDGSTPRSALEIENGASPELLLMKSKGVVAIGTNAPTLSGSGKLHMAADTIRLDTSRSPASNGTGYVGEICWDASYVYICTATNTWKRTALTGGY